MLKVTDSRTGEILRFGCISSNALLIRIERRQQRLFDDVSTIGPERIAELRIALTEL